MSESAEELEPSAAARAEGGKAEPAMVVVLRVTGVILLAADIESSRVANRAFRLLGTAAAVFTAWALDPASHESGER